MRHQLQSTHRTYRNAFRVFKRTIHVHKTNDLLINSTDNAITIALNRPDCLNAINKAILIKMQETLKDAEYQKKLIILKGKREKIFCCGGDIKSSFDKVHNRNELEYVMEILKLLYLMTYMIKYYKLPYITLINGLAMGAGLGLSVHGRYRIATENTVVAMPETRIGLVTDVSGTFFLPRLPRNFGVYMGMTGTKVKGKSVVRAGIATHFVPQARLCELEASLIQCTDEAEIKRVVDQFKEPTDNCPMDDNIDHIERCFEAATVEEIIERLQCVKNDWSRRALKSLTEASPTSTKITLRAIQRGASMKLAECLEMELRLMRKRFIHQDFVEGIRARLLDKDNKPKWKPANLADVNEEFVESYFRRLQPEHETEIEKIKMENLKLL